MLETVHLHTSFQRRVTLHGAPIYSSLCLHSLLCLKTFRFHRFFAASCMAACSLPASAASPKLYVDWFSNCTIRLTSPSLIPVPSRRTYSAGSFISTISIIANFSISQTATALSIPLRWPCPMFFSPLREIHASCFLPRCLGYRWNSRRSGRSQIRGTRPATAYSGNVSRCCFPAFLPVLV